MYGTILSTTLHSVRGISRLLRFRFLHIGRSGITIPQLANGRHFTMQPIFTCIYIYNMSKVCWRSYHSVTIYKNNIWTRIHVYIYIHVYTIIYRYVPLYTVIFHYIPLYTIIYRYIPLYIIIFHYIPFYSMNIALIHVIHSSASSSIS